MTPNPLVLDLTIDMIAFLRSSALAVAVLLAVFSVSGRAVAAAEPQTSGPAHVVAANQEDGGAESDSRDIVPIVLWMLGGVAAPAVVLSALYLVKRSVGGFPKNPSWVAPISIMPSAELPGDRDPHEAGPEEGHHAAAGTHH